MLYADSPKDFFRRLFAPDFWVCVYASVDYDEGPPRCSGKFCALGKTREEAEADALTEIEKHAMIFGNVRYRVRRPNLWERLFG